MLGTSDLKNRFRIVLIFRKFQGACLLVLMLLLLPFLHVFHHLVLSSSYCGKKDA